MQKSYYPKADEVKRNWVLIDLKDKVLGRAATQIADTLRGKNKPTFTPSVDTGDFVVAINAAQIKLSGEKLNKKKYYWHTGFIGGIKEVSAGEILGKKPTELIRRAVQGMLPKNKLQKHYMTKFKIYADDKHPHVAQFTVREKKVKTKKEVK